MPLPRVIPALADLTQDIAGPLPLKLFQDWAAGKQDLQTAQELLHSFQIEGTVVSSDTSGLSKLTEEKDLLDVLSLISGPKQIVHGLGAEIGGRSIGTWVADNTEMYYPPSVTAGNILLAMTEAQFRIAAESPVRIGMCVHAGRFYEIGGGLYGRDADTVEYLAEEKAGAGEIIITQDVIDLLRDSIDHSCRPRNDLQQFHPAGVFTFLSEKRMPHLKGTAIRYPHPYPEEFFQLLCNLKDRPQSQHLKEQIYAAYLREQVIVFLAREHEPVQTETLATLLDDLVINALMDTVIKGTMSAKDHVASSAGGRAILTFDRPQQGLDFARAIREKFLENGLPVKAGIDQGPVLFFQNSKESGGIAGDPVNIASKISEDTGRPGKINITSRVARRLGNLSTAESFQIVVSGVLLTGVTV